MKLRALLERLASRSLQNDRLRSLGRAVVPSSRVRARARAGLEAAIRRDFRHDEEVFRSVLCKRSEARCIPRRVVLVCDSLGPGGSERQVVNTLNGLARAGFTDLHLLCGELRPGRGCQHDFFLERARRSGALVRTIRPNLHRQHSRTLLPQGFGTHFDSLHPEVAVDVANLYWELRELRPGIVHAWLDRNNVIAGLAAALSGVPRIIVSTRSVGPHHFAFHAPYMHSAYRALCSVPGVTLVNNSRAGTADYAAWLGIDPGNIRVIYNGVDAPHEKAPIERERWRQRLGIPAGAPVVGGMFRFSPEKRPLLWLEVAAAVAAARSQVWFVVFGDGDLRRSMEASARRLGLTNRLRMPGVTACSFSSLGAMDAVLLTSLWEGTPNVALEAQWCGVPVIATRAGGSAEAVENGDTGWIVDASDAATIAERVLATLDDLALRQRILTAGPRFISKRFGQERMIEETLGAYGLTPPLGEGMRFHGSEMVTPSA